MGMDRKRKRTATWVAIVTCLFASGFAASAQAQEEQAKAAFTRPKYSSVLRQKEDWSGLADQDRTQTGDIFDRIKYIPLSDDGMLWVSFGGQIRLRFENFSNFGFGPANDDDYLLTRLRAHADIHYGKNLRFFIEGKSAFSTDRSLPGARRGLDADELDLLQAFVDITIPLENENKLTIRIGRQMLLFGKQRLISPLDWSNTIRSWDGILASLDYNGWNITGFWTNFVPVQKYSFNTTDSQTDVYGVYITTRWDAIKADIDLYFLGLSGEDLVTFNGSTGLEDRYTVGGRLEGKIVDSGVGYELEGAYQFGRVGTADVSAYFIASQLNYKVTQIALKPKFWVGLDYASGDKTAGDGSVGTFKQLFPLGHAYNGYIDIIGRQNIIDLNLGAKIKPCKKAIVSLQGHLFWLAETTDGLYNAGGGLVRAGGLSTNSEAGSEIDLVVKYQFDRHLQGLFGYSHFFTGEYVKQATPAASSDIDFVYVEFKYTF